MHLELTDSEMRLLRNALDAEICQARQKLADCQGNGSKRETSLSDIERLEQIQRRLATDAVVAEDQVAS